MLLMADGFAHEAFETIAVDGTTHVLLAEDQPDPRMAQRVGTSQRQQSFTMDLVRSVVENVLVVPGIQQTQLPGKTLIGHSASDQALRRLRPLARRRAMT